MGTRHENRDVALIVFSYIAGAIKNINAINVKDITIDIS